MKKFMGLFSALVALLLGSFSPLAKADAPPADSLFVKLQTQFNQATFADLKPLVGHLDAGRCFSYEAPNNPIASVLLSSYQVVDNGPLGSAQPQFQMSVTAEPTLPADYFDRTTVTSSDMNVDPGQLPLSQIDAKTYQLTLANGSSIQFRAVGATIVAQGRAVWGDTTLMCYYFKVH